MLPIRTRSSQVRQLIIAQRSFHQITSQRSKMAGKHFEPPQPIDATTFKPDPSKSIKLSPQRQALLDDILALYACQPSVERIKRYTPDAVYDDQFGYANNRYKIAGQWFALPKLFSASENVAHEVIRNDDDLIQYKSQQKWTFRLLSKSTTMQSVVSLSLDPATKDSDFIQVKYHKDQSQPDESSKEGLGFNLKKWQADNVPKHLDEEKMKIFEQDNLSSNEDGGK